MENISAKACPLVSPILKLGPNEWSSIAPFLGPNDVLHLRCCGNAPLSLGLAYAGHLNLEWRSGRYVDYSEVFTTLKQFKSVYGLEFSVSSERLLYWTPVNWSQLPTVLNSLRIVATDAPFLLLGSGSLATLLPNLTNLDLVELNVHPVAFGPVTHWLDLRTLAPGLLHLCLKSARPHCLVLEQLERLPSGLLTFDLDIGPQAVTQEEADLLATGAVLPPATRRHAVLLPHLPRSLTRLSLKDYPTASAWRIDGSVLPTSLTYFSYFGLNHPRFEPEMPLENTSSVVSWNIHKHGEQFKHLKTLLLPTVAIIMGDAVEHFPPSLTVLDASFKSGALRGDAKADPIEAFLQKIAPKLIRSDQSDWPEVDKAILSGKLFNDSGASKLAAVSRNPLEGDAIVLPKGIKRYSGNASRLEINAELENLQLFPTSGIPPSILWNFGSTLTSISLRFSISRDHILALPRTLEHLMAAISDLDSWNLLTSLIGPHGQLPHLKQLILFENHLDIQVLESIPQQLEKLEVGLDARTLAPYASVAPPSAFFSSLKQSRITTLTITFLKHSETPQLPFVLGLLNALPPTLKTLSFGSRCMPSRYWPVILPSRLNSLRMTLRKQRFVEAVEHYQVPETIDLGDPSLCPFTLPSTLTSLHLDQMELPIPLEHLPPHISTFSVLTRSRMPVDQSPYFESRTPPKHLQDPKLVY